MERFDVDNFCMPTRNKYAWKEKTPLLKENSSRETVNSQNLIHFNLSIKQVKMGEKKSYVYIKSKESAWVPAIQTHTDGKKATVTVPQYKDEQSMDSDGGRAAKKGVEETVDLKGYISNVLPLQNVDGSGQLLEFADMVELPYLHEVSYLIIGLPSLPIRILLALLRGASLARYFQSFCRRLIIVNIEIIGRLSFGIFEDRISNIDLLFSLSRLLFK